MQGRKKHLLMILLLLLIAFVSLQMMTSQNHTEKKTRITVILPKDSQKEMYGLLDGIRDQAYDDHVKLDVWYKSRLTKKNFDKLIKEERENGSEGVLLVYPEMYLEKKNGSYKENDVLAVTDTMQSAFQYYAAVSKSKKEQYRLPVEDTVLEQVKNGEKPFIYVENTYRLGYESMQMLAKKGKTKKMKSICLKPVKLDKERIESGEYDALLSR